MKLVSTGMTILAACFMMGCEVYKGGLSIQQALILRAKKGDISLPAGNYQAEIKPGSDEIKLKVRVGGKEQKIEFALPNGRRIYSFSQIDLAPSESGQHYHLKGTETSKVLSAGRLKRGSQVCGTGETTCGYEGEPTDGNPFGEWVCHEEVLTEEIEYYDLNKEVTRQIFILDPGTLQTLGTFVSVAQEKQRITNVVGSCN